MADKEFWLVWSNEHGAWWGPERRGYSLSLTTAGRYTLEEALSCCASRSDLVIDHPPLRLPPELPIPEHAAYALQKRRGRAIVQ